MTLYEGVNSDKSVTAKASLGSWGGYDEAVSFPTWSAVLAAREDLDPDRKLRWKFAITGLLRFCKVERRPVSITLIKGYLDELSMQGKLVAEAREVFLWFVAEARKRGRVNGSADAVGYSEPDRRSGLHEARERASDRSMPSVGANDMGGPEWPRKRLRPRGSGRLRGSVVYRSLISAAWI